MKYLVIVYDGMADRKIPALGNKTPMQVAKKPNLDRLSSSATVGTVSNVPEGMVPESDTANLSILSYDPRLFSKGRSPLEAMSMRLEMSPEDTAYRTNLVTLSEEAGLPYCDRTILDHSSDEITTEEADELITDEVAMTGLQREPGAGSGYRGYINIGVIDQHFEAGETVTLEILKQKKLIEKKAGRVKVLADGTLNKPLVIKAEGFSIQAIKMIELTGGTPIMLI